MKSKLFCGIAKAIDVFIKGSMICFLALFACCIFLKSKLLFTPVTLFSLVLFLCAVFVSKYKTECSRGWMFAVFLTAFLIRLVFIKIWPITPLSDCEMGYILSEQLSNTPIQKWHEIFAANKYYYDVWPMHVPFIVYQTLCLKLFGNSIVSIQIVNMFFSALTCVFVAICAEGLSKSKRAGIVAGLLMSFNMTTLFMACFLVNQHVSTCLFVASMCFIIKKPLKSNMLNYLVSGILLAFGQLMRPEMTIVLIAVWCVVLYEIFELLSIREMAKIKKVSIVLAKGVVFAVAFFLVINLANSALFGLRWIDNPITESKIEYKLMIGLNQETEGRFQDSDYPLAANDIAVKEVLAERISSPAETVELMARKLYFQFTSYNYWWLQADKGGAVRQFVIDKIFEPLTQSYMFFVFVMATVGIIKLRKSKDKRLSLLYIIYFGFMCAFALTEVQQRYAYITIPVLTVLSAMVFGKKPIKKEENV